MNVCALLVEIQGGTVSVEAVQNMKPRARQVATHLQFPNCASTIRMTAGLRPALATPYKPVSQN